MIGVVETVEEQPRERRIRMDAIRFMRISFVA